MASSQPGVADGALYRRALENLNSTLIRDLDPDTLLDYFVETEYLPITQIRDIQELQTTSQKNRRILRAVKQFIPAKYDLFKQCLVKSGQKHLVDYINVEENRLKTERSSMNIPIVKKMATQQTTPIIDIDRTPSDKELRKISECIGFGWQQLATALDISTATVERISLDNPHRTLDQIFYMLIVWRDSAAKDEATIRLLLETMKDIYSMTIDWDSFGKKLGFGLDALTQPKRLKKTYTEQPTIGLIARRPTTQARELSNEASITQPSTQVVPTMHGYGSAEGYSLKYQTENVDTENNQQGLDDLKRRTQPRNISHSASSSQCGETSQENTTDKRQTMQKSNANSVKDQVQYHSLLTPNIGNQVSYSNTDETELNTPASIMTGHNDDRNNEVLYGGNNTFSVSEQTPTYKNDQNPNNRPGQSEDNSLLEQTLVSDQTDAARLDKLPTVQNSRAIGHSSIPGPSTVDIKKEKGKRPGLYEEMASLLNKYNPTNADENLQNESVGHGDTGSAMPKESERPITPQDSDINDVRLPHMEGEKEAIERLEQFFEPRYDGRLLQLNEQLVDDIKRFCDDGITSGGYGAVHVTSKQPLPGLKSKVALKEIKTGSDQEGSDERKLRSVTNEKLASRMLHFGICPVIASWEKADKSLSCLLSPYLENRSLLDAIKEKKLDLQNSLKVLHQIASAIDYLHTPVKHFKETDNRDHCREVILHKDLKTANIVLDKANNARLIDFGLAREMAEGKDKHTATRFGIQGTVGYIPTGEFDHITTFHDYHNFGVVIRELLTGNPPTVEVTRPKQKKVELRNSSEQYIRNRYADIWKKDADTKGIAERLLKLSTKCIDSILPKTIGVSSTYIKDEIESINGSCMNSRRWTRLDDEKCEMCMVNNAGPMQILSGHTDECTNNGTQIQICAACMRNAYLNPIRCHSCNGNIKPPVGDDWCAVLIAGNDYRLDVASAFKKGVDDLHEVMVSKYPPVMGLSESEAIRVCPATPGVKQPLRDDIGHAFEQLAQKAHGTVVFLFSGHYLQSKESFQLGLTENDEIIKKTEIEQLMGKFNAPGRNTKFLVILECCNPPKFDMPVDTVYVQLSACRSNEKISSLTVEYTSLFTTFLRQALIRYTLDETCKNAPKNRKFCQSCHIEGDFITVEAVIDYISQHIEEFTTRNKGEKYPAPVWHGDNVKFKHAIVAFKYNFKVEIVFELKFNGNSPDTVCLKPTIYKTMEQLKTDLLNQMKETFGIWNKLDAKAYSDILCIEHETGPKTEEIHTLPTLMTAWTVKRELRATPRGIDEIRKGMVGAHISDANVLFNTVKEIVEHDGSCASIQFIDDRIDVTIKSNGIWTSLKDHNLDEETVAIIGEIHELEIDDADEVHMIFPKAEITSRSDGNASNAGEPTPDPQMGMLSLDENVLQNVQIRPHSTDENQRIRVVHDLVPDFVCFQLIKRGAANETSGLV